MPDGPFKDPKRLEKGRELPLEERETAVKARDPLFGGLKQWVALLIQ